MTESKLGASQIIAVALPLVPVVPWLISLANNGWVALFNTAISILPYLLFSLYSFMHIRNIKLVKRNTLIFILMSAMSVAFVFSKTLGNQNDPVAEYSVFITSVAQTIFVLAYMVVNKLLGV